MKKDKDFSPAQSALPPLRVMLFDHTAQLGGGEIALLELVAHFAPEKVTPIVVIAAEGPLSVRMRPIAETHVIELDSDVVQARKDSLGSSRSKVFTQVFKSVRYITTLASFIRKNKIDIVHTNSLKADILGGIAAKLAGRKLIWHIRDRIEDDYLPARVVRLFRMLARRLPDFIIGNSDATIETLHLEGRVPSEAVASGVDLSTFKGSEGAEKVASSFFDIGIIGRLCEWKGQHIFLQAAAEIAPKFPQARFKVIGAPLFGEEEYASELRALSHSLGIDDVVDFMGFRSDVRTLIQQLDLVVHASTTGEPLGQVILQGMAAGKPVIATRGGGVPEIMLDNVTGILVPMGDAAEMASAMTRILSSAELASSMGARGRRHVEESFTIQATTKKTERIYEKVLRRSG